jgi:hypothetical protein
MRDARIMSQVKIRMRKDSRHCRQLHMAYNRHSYAERPLQPVDNLAI